MNCYGDKVEVKENLDEAELKESLKLEQWRCGNWYEKKKTVKSVGEIFRKP